MASNPPPPLIGLICHKEATNAAVKSVVNAPSWSEASEQKWSKGFMIWKMNRKWFCEREVKPSCYEKWIGNDFVKPGNYYGEMVGSGNSLVFWVIVLPNYICRQETIVRSPSVAILLHFSFIVGYIKEFHSIIFTILYRLNLSLILFIRKVVNARVIFSSFFEI